LADGGGAQAFDPGQILRVLVTHRVDFVLIGGMAAVLYGSPLPTLDVDITPERQRDNLARLSNALTELDARLRADGIDQPLPFGHDADSLADGGVWNLSTRYGDLDISMTPSGTSGFADLRRDARAVELYGLSIRVISLADVIRSKEAAGRDKDRRVLPVLRELLAERGHDRGGRDRW
jgi:hypothetical protein